MKETITLTKQADGSFAFEIPEEKKEVELHAGIAGAAVLDKIPDYKVAGIPIGEAAKAMLVAGAGDAVGTLAIKILPQSVVSGTFSIAVLKAMTIAALNWHPVKNFLGKDAVEKGSIILAYEGIASIFNARLKIYNLLATVTSKVAPAKATNGAATNGNGSNGVDVIT